MQCTRQCMTDQENRELFLGAKSERRNSATLHGMTNNILR